MIRRTMTASALFLAMTGNAGSDRTDSMQGSDDAAAVTEQTVGSRPTIPLLPDWTRRWDERRCWIATPQRGEHMALWFHPTHGSPTTLLDGFIQRFVSSASSPSVLGGVPAEQVIGKGVSSAGRPLIGVAMLAPSSAGTLVLASRGFDMELPGRFRDLLVMSTLV